MTDRGSMLVKAVAADEEHMPAVKAVLAKHFDVEVQDDGSVHIDNYGSDAMLEADEDGVLSMDSWCDNQDNYGNAEALLHELIAAGATSVTLLLSLHDGTYHFRSRGSDTRIDCGDSDGNLYITETALNQMLNELTAMHVLGGGNRDVLEVAALHERLSAHFGTDW